MDWHGVYDQLRNHNWICYKNGYQTVNMGKFGGHLSFSFSDTGELFSVAHFEFLPDMRFWEFDQAKQLIILLNDQKEPVNELSLPKLEGTRLVLHDQNSRDIFACVLAVDNGLLLAEAPDAMVLNLGQSVISQSSQVIIRIGTSFKPNSANVFLEDTTDFDYCTITPTSYEFWKAIYIKILKHPNWQKIAILENRWQIKNNFFSKLEKDILYVGDQFGRTKLGQKLDFSVLIGQRSVMIEFISTILLELDEITDDQLTVLAYNYFSDRITHGREITQLGEFKTSRTWVNGTE